MIKRRDFLKKSGMIALAAAFPGIVNAEVEATDGSAVLNKNRIKVNNQWDVIVVGGGPAGCAAAAGRSHCGGNQPRGGHRH